MNYITISTRSNILDDNAHDHLDVIGEGAYQERLDSVFNSEETRQAFEALCNENLREVMEDWDVVPYNGEQYNVVQEELGLAINTTDEMATMILDGTPTVFVNVTTFMGLPENNREALFEFSTLKETVHLEQVKRGDLVVASEGVYWHGHVWDRARISTETHNATEQATAEGLDESDVMTKVQVVLPWEHEAMVRTICMFSALYVYAPTPTQHEIIEAWFTYIRKELENYTGENGTIVFPLLTFPEGTEASLITEWLDLLNSNIQKEGQ